VSQDVLALGDELIKQLGEVADRNLLVKWMAQHLADLMLQYKRASGLDKLALGEQCAAIIMEIWSNRHHLPSGARPLEDFEPLFNIVAQLKADDTRYPTLRILGRNVEATGPGSKIFNAALAIDKAASSLIRYSLAEMAAQLAIKNNKWAEIAKFMSPRDHDMEIILTAYSEKEKLIDKNARLNKRDIEDIETMIGRLELLERRAPVVRAHLEEKLKAAKKKKRSHSWFDETATPRC
jgi:hypothetical protein